MLKDVKELKEVKEKAEVVHGISFVGDLKAPALKDSRIGPYEDDGYPD